MKIWANSGDSHFLEPMDLFRDSLPADLAERLPRSEKDEAAGTETVYVDGQRYTEVYVDGDMRVDVVV